MIYDFIEIGTSNFDACIESANDDTIGLSIEPIRHYLDALPNKPNVKKINVAISLTNIEETAEVFYVPEDIIDKMNLPQWLKGCNCIGKYHMQHYQRHPAYEKENILDLVKRELVISVPIGKLFDDYNVTGVNYLKIDTEGADCDILQHYYEYLKTKPKSYYPKKIRFETNELTPEDKMHKVRQLFISIGYDCPALGWPDTILELKTTLRDQFTLEEMLEKTFSSHANRRDSFAKMIAHLKTIDNPVIIETGCSRETNNWSGDGMSTVIFDKYINDYNGVLHSVDIDANNVRTATSLVSDKTTVHCSDSVAWLQNFNQLNKKIDLLYLDSFDYHIDSRLSMQHHMNELTAALPSLKNGTMIAVDDHFGDHGKGELVKQFMEQIEVPLIHNGYQLIWQWNKGV